MTIIEKGLMRKFCLFGCTGRYSENEETLSLIYNGTKIGWMERRLRFTPWSMTICRRMRTQVFSADPESGKGDLASMHASMKHPSPEGRLPAN